MKNKIDKLKQNILNKVKEYYYLQEDQKKKKTYYPYAGRIYDENEMMSLVNSALDFWLTEGKYCKEFEKGLKEFLHIKHCTLVNSGSSANLLAFMTLTSDLLGDKKINRGDEIITVACCFPTTISPIINYGAIPVFVDVEVDTLNIDIKKMKKALSSHTKAVMIAHTLGNPFNVEKVVDFCKENNLWLIEDNCDSLGSKHCTQYTGTFGDISTSSFYPPHHITTGEGGAIFTNNDLLHKIIKSMRDWGRDCVCDSGQDNKCGHRFDKKFKKLPLGYDHKYIYSHFGYNLKMTDMQASIGVEQLKKLQNFILTRRDNFIYLYENLMILKNYFIFPNCDILSFPSPFGFWLTIKDNNKFTRNDITKFLESKNIQTRNVFSGNIIKHPCFDNLKKNKDYKVVGSLKNTNKIMNDTFWIGVYPGLKNKDLDYIIQQIKNFISTH